jgi:hypothetical protein
MLKRAHAGAKSAGRNSPQHLKTIVGAVLSMALNLPCRNWRRSARNRPRRKKKERAAWRKRKAAVKPLRHWEDMTQRVVNDYIRERDHDLPCISCGTFETVQWEAGHYLPR